MSLPRLSVALSVRDGAAYLAPALDSLLDQSFRDFELLAIDDGSTDDTPEILASYAARDSRLHALENPTNLGLTRSLNRALGEARGAYVARQDADDLAEPGRLAMQVELLDREPEVVAVGGGVRVIDNEGRELARYGVPQEHEAITAHLLFDNCLPHTTLLLRRDALERIGGYDERHRFAQDYDLLWRLAAVGRLAAVPKTVAAVRKHPGRIAERHAGEQRQAALAISQRIVREIVGPALDDAAYGRFWLALHGELEALDAGDLEALAPLWSFLEASRPHREVWAEPLSGLALRLTAAHPAAGGELAAVAARLGHRFSLADRYRLRRGRRRAEAGRPPVR